jgi:threonine dehydrogenase-like Zn-dependent dehydrogenase
VNKKPLVAILGCGPSGLLAAHACQSWQVPFVILSRPVKSRLGGAQFSHIAIPGINYEDPEALITYRIQGDSETYHDKVYGKQSVPFVSIEHHQDGDQVPAWNLLRLYDQLWDEYHRRVVPFEVGPYKAVDLKGGIFDLVFSSVPLPSICMGSTENQAIGHWFKSQTVHILNGALDSSLPDNTILYDGTHDHSWYRMSNLFGTGSTEWGSGSPRPPVSDLKTVNKPIDTNCDCHSSIIRIGRFGTWKKGALTYHAYNTVVDTLAKTGVAS